MEGFCEVTENLQRYLLHDVEQPSEQEYGAAENMEIEVEYKGLTCSALRPAKAFDEHKIKKDKSSLLQRIADVCDILARLRHPHVVQFLGVSCDSSSPRGFPLIVNELSSLSLGSCVTRYGVLPNELSYNILRDVALGLRYLHEQTPSVVHGDLSARSVHITGDFTAKISRVGVSLLGDSPVKTKHRELPPHLPPEAIDQRLERKVDIFSFGVLMLHTFSGRPPIPKRPTPTPERGEECSTPSTGVKVLSQADLRVEYLNDLGFSHPAMDTILHCLRNQPILRPEIWEITPGLGKQADSHRNKCVDYATHLDILHSFERERKRKFRKFSTQVSSSDSAYGSVSDADVEELQIRVRRLSVQNQTLRRLSLTPQGVLVNRNRNNSRPLLPLLPRPLTPDRVKLDWEQCTQMPVGMFRAQAAVIDDCVYVGGGLTEDEHGDFCVFEYNLSDDSWSLLPPAPVKQFGLAKLLEELIIVGGLVDHETISNKTYTFDRYNQVWKESVAVLNRPRFLLTLVESEAAIIAMGGVGKGREGELEVVSSIEILTAESLEWVLTGDLPASACVCSPSPAKEGSILYLLGGYQTQTAASATSRVHCSSLATLFSASGMKLNLWTLLPPTPFLQTTAISLNKCLLALGGSEKPYSVPVHSSIHAYDADAQQWKEVEQLPYACCHCTTVALSRQEILVLGGWVKPGERKASRNVYRGTIVESYEDLQSYMTACT